jgi:hypothetical protein
VPEAKICVSASKHKGFINFIFFPPLTDSYKFVGFILKDKDFRSLWQILFAILSRFLSFITIL